MSSHPPPHGPPTPAQCEAGKIILLNGASSSGKSTLARQLQSQLVDEPFLVLSSDQLVDGGALPHQRSRQHNPTDPFSWPAVMRPRFFSGFHGCIAAMCRAGNNVIVDHIIEYPHWVDELLGLLRGVDVWIVAVHCEVDELERREKRRGDRYIGEARQHLEDNRIHEVIGYDFQIDTTSATGEGVAAEKVQDLVDAWKSRDPNRTSFCAPSTRPRLAS